MRPSQRERGTNRQKQDFITGILVTGARPVPVKIVEGLTPYMAKRVEADMIALLRPQLTNGHQPDGWVIAQTWARRTLQTIQTPGDPASMAMYQAIVSDLQRLAA